MKGSVEVDFRRVYYGVIGAGGCLIPEANARNASYLYWLYKMAYSRNIAVNIAVATIKAAAESLNTDEEYWIWLT
jgi:hypothetical protein